MKKYFSMLIIGYLLLIPEGTLAKKFVCKNDLGNEAIVEIDKDSLKIGEQAFIAVKSDEEIYRINYGTKNLDIISVDGNGIVKGKNAGMATVTTTVTFDPEHKCNVEFPITVNTSDSSLKSLTLNEYDMSNIFNKEKYEYEINLPYKTEEINIKAAASSDKATILGTGKKYLNVGDNKIAIVVTADDGTKTTYTLNVIRDKGNSDNSLKDLTVEGYSLTPEFNPNTKEYTLEVAEDVTEIKINATANNEEAKIKGTGTFSLASGTSAYYINVIAEDGSINKYEIIINRKKGTTKLTNLKIVGFNLEPKFTSNVFTYYLNVGSDIQTLDIQAEGEEDDNIVITGNEYLEEGNNEILIKVSNPQKSTNTYKLIVNKMNKEIENKIKKNFILVKVLLVLFILSVIIMGTLIGIFIKRNMKRKPKLKRNIKKKYKK